VFLLEKTLRQQLEARLKQLKAEYATSQRELTELQNKEASIKQTLERIRTAIEALEEQLKKRRLV
jgi:septal ring factor EnvC (AmiA/AmiB activator)